MASFNCSPRRTSSLLSLSFTLVFFVVPAVIESLKFPTDDDDRSTLRQFNKDRSMGQQFPSSGSSPLPVSSRPSAYLAKKPNLIQNNSTNKPLIGSGGSDKLLNGLQPSIPTITGKDSYRETDKTGNEVGTEIDTHSSTETAPMTSVSNKNGDYNGNGNGNGDCVCVPYYQCDNGKVIEDGSGLIDPRIKTNPKSAKSASPMEGKANPSYCGTFHVCCSDPETVTTQPYLHRCGIQNPTGINSRILSPDRKGESDFGEWPWQAAILKSESNVNVFQCGGTLIDDYFIITVAHCVRDFVASPEALKVRLGEWDTANDNEFYPHEDFEVEKIYLHPEFRANNLWNDVALVRLSRPVQFKPNIDSVCLPSYGENHDFQECVTTGWGKSAYKGGSYSTILKEISVQVVPHENCQQALRQTRLGSRFKLHPGFMCAGGEASRDSCKGDGGGPLVCYRQDGTYSLVGLVAWGVECGKEGVPGVYMDITKYLDWIVGVTGKDINYYSSPVANTEMHKKPNHGYNNSNVNSKKSNPKMRTD